MSEGEKKQVVVKVGMLGDVQVGKTSLMYKYVEGKFNEDYIMTLGVNFLEKNLKVMNNDITIMIWDLGGQKEYQGMLDIVCNESLALLFMFDLSRRATLNSVKDWYLQARKFNKRAIPILVGTKYDKFLELSKEDQVEITDQARKYAEKMKSPLVFCSAQAGVNVNKLFKLVIGKVFDLKPDFQKISNYGDPIIEF